MDYSKVFGAVDCSVEAGERDGEAVRAVKLSRVCDTDTEDLWDAFTNPERLPRSFLPVEGDLRPGGKYQLIGNARGTILVCDKPKQLSLTWEMGAMMSWLDLHVAPEGDGARLTLIHTAPVNDHWETYGPGATGIGWDLGLMGLQFHLANPDAKFDESKFGQSEEGRQMIRNCGAAWGKADAESGAAAAVAEKRAAHTTAFYLGEKPPEE